jgi:DNA-nicking Smr family endonuclease
MAKRNDHFNPLFKGRPVRVKPRDPKPGRPEEPKAGRHPSPPPQEPDRDEFNHAMSGVKPLPDDSPKRVRRGARLRPAGPVPDERREVMDHLQGLVRGAIEMDITFSDEYIQGSVRGFNREIMRRLKRGEFPVQDHIDLHGLTREEAEAAVREFILTSFRLGLRCVLIIHGRGLNSPESFPVLKEGLPIWLGRGPVKRIVLAFATARPYDGGTGAVYVLLRKR